METAAPILAIKPMPATTTGDGAAIAPPAIPRIQPADARQVRYTQAFANIIAVMMRDPVYRNLRLTDLEWLVLPAIMSGQWRLGQSSADGVAGATAAATNGGKPLVVPVAAALWASVSADIDKRLTEVLDKPVFLKPNEWLTGDNIWLIAAAGDPRVVPKLLTRMAETEFKGRQVKLRSVDAHGNPTVSSLKA